MTKKLIEAMKKQYPEGSRVRLLRMDDPQAPPRGTCGTVRCVDSMATIHVDWDNGSGLGVVYDSDDMVERIDKE